MGSTQLTRLLITGSAPQHVYVANRLAQEIDLESVIVDKGRRQSRGERARRLLRRYSVGELWSRLACRTANAVWRSASERARKLLRILGPDAEDFRSPSRLHYVEGINSPSGEQLVRGLNADQILIFGTTIIGSKILRLSKKSALNMHTGISPHYRGSSCAFWPVHDGRFDMLGATIHRCVPTVDAGEIYAVGRAKLAADDDLHAVFARCVQIGADLYVDVVKHFEQIADAGQPQDLTVGREYRAADRTLAAELRARRRLRQGELRRYVEQTSTKVESD